jgi:small subunit ribosomal protein S3
LGRKVHPVGFRLGIIRDWQARWYAEKGYTDLLHEDFYLRQLVFDQLNNPAKMGDAAVAMVEIERSANQVTVTIHTAKPGVVIGKGGTKVEELRQMLEQAVGKKVRLNITEIRQPELNAFLVARTIAEQLEKRVAYKRAMKQAVARAMRLGAKGIKVLCKGRLAGAEMKRREWERAGRVPLQTLRADIDYGQTEAHTTFGRIGVKVWIYKGDILPERRGVPAPAGHAVTIEPEIIQAEAAPGAAPGASPAVQAASTAPA